MPKLLTKLKSGLREVFSERELLAESHHKRAERAFLHLRNTAVTLAAALFLGSLPHTGIRYLLKAIAYFFGAAAYLCEILLLTDCFTRKVPHRELFMAYCFGPVYLLLGISYLLH